MFQSNNSIKQKVIGEYLMSKSKIIRLISLFAIVIMLFLSAPRTAIAGSYKERSRFFPRETTIYDSSSTGRQKLGREVKSRVFLRETNIHDDSGRKVGTEVQSRIFPRKTNIYDGSGQKVGTEVQSRIFPRKANIYDGSGQKVGTEVQSRIFPRGKNIRGKSSIELLK
jgi:hypothetical protein